MKWVKLLLQFGNIKLSFFFFFFFFCIWVFCHNHSWITRLQGKGEGISVTPHYHFHPLQRHLDIRRAITAESSPLHIGSSRTRTGNLWRRFNIFCYWLCHLLFSCFSMFEWFPRNVSNNLTIGKLSGVFKQWEAETSFKSFFQLNIFWRILHKELLFFMSPSLYLYIYTYLYIYLYIYREREI